MIASGRSVLEIRHLRLIAAIAREGSVTAAAGTLNLSQSALSHQLLNLERDLGTALFRRVGKRMVLTGAGELVATAAARLLPDIELVEAGLRDAKAERRVLLRVAAGCQTLYPWLAEQLGKYAVADPTVDARLAFETRDRDGDELRSADADLVISSRPPDDRNHVKIPLFSLETIALLPRVHRLAGQDRIAWSDLAGETLLIHDLPAADVTQLRAATAKGGRAARVCRVQLTEAIVELVRAGQGIGLLSRLPAASPPVLPSIAVRTLRGGHRRDFWASWRVSSDAAAAAGRLGAYLRDAARASPHNDEESASKIAS